MASVFWRTENEKVAATPSNRVGPTRGKAHEKRKLRWKEGDRVCLPASASYKPSRLNPKKGSTFACYGCVQRDPAFQVVVKWDNGYKNVYKAEELSRSEYFAHYFGETCEEGHPSRCREKELEALNTSHLKFQQGELVFLKPGFHPPTLGNPCLGSTHQCPGEVCEVKERGRGQLTKVRWHNGMYNSYGYRSDHSENECALVSAENKDLLRETIRENPNIAFKLAKIVVGEVTDYFGIGSIIGNLLEIGPKPSGGYRAEYFKVEDSDADFYDDF